MQSVLYFIAITFITTFSLEAWLISGGTQFSGEVMQAAPTLWLMSVMWIPGLAAIIVTKFVEGAPLKEALNLRIGSLGPYLLTILIAPLAFAAMYALSWAAGLSTPDPTLAGLSEAAGSTESITMDTVFKFLLPMSMFAGPLINFVFGLGEELGWRGFLLPRLMVLGKTKAYALLALLWGLWHAPIIWVGFNYPGYQMSGLAMMILLCFAFGLFINEMTLHYRSVLLAAFIHGAVNAQGFGIWSWLFPATDPLLGGGTGVTGVVVWLAIGGATMWVLNRLTPDQA